jgi:hypothetical protein
MGRPCQKPTLSRQLREESVPEWRLRSVGVESAARLRADGNKNNPNSAPQQRGAVAPPTLSTASVKLRHPPRRCGVRESAMNGLQPAAGNAAFGRRSRQFSLVTPEFLDLLGVETVDVLLGKRVDPAELSLLLGGPKLGLWGGGWSEALGLCEGFLGGSGGGFTEVTLVGSGA